MIYEFFILWKSGNTFELRANLIGSNQAVNSLDFDSTGTLILGTSNDFASRVWGIADHRLRVSKKLILNFIFENFSLFLEKFFIENVFYYKNLRRKTFFKKLILRIEIFAKLILFVSSHRCSWAMDDNSFSLLILTS